MLKRHRSEICGQLSRDYTTEGNICLHQLLTTEQTGPRDLCSMTDCWQIILCVLVWVITAALSSLVQWRLPRRQLCTAICSTSCLLPSYHFFCNVLWALQSVWLMTKHPQSLISSTWTSNESLEYLKTAASQVKAESWCMSVNVFRKQLDNLFI